jgi:hypothetical protein
VKPRACLVHWDAAGTAPRSATLRALGYRVDASVLEPSELRRLWPRATRHGVPLWIFWTKRSASATSDVDQRVVRAYGLERGWVDHKIARLDSTWAGLRFAKRGSGRAG